MNKRAIMFKDYDPIYERHFIDAKISLKRVLSRFKYVITHIGSTSIKNCKGKPVIDVLLGVGSTTDLLAIKDILVFRGLKLDPCSTLNCLILLSYTKEELTSKIFITIYKSDIFEEFIRFRNCLITNSELVDKYNNVREASLLSRPFDDDCYLKAKKDFFLEYKN